MAAKDAVAIILDVGLSMSQAPPGHETYLETSIKAINMIIQRKMFASAKDEFCLILFGTDGTENHLHDEFKGYENITVARDLGLPDLELLRFIHSDITPGNQETDFIDAVVVAMDLLRRRTAGYKKVEKKIYLFTDLGSPFCKDQLQTIINGLNEMEAGFVLVGPDLLGDDDNNDDNDSDDITQPSTSNGATSRPHRKPKTPQQIAGEECIRDVLEAVEGQTYSFSQVLPMLSFFECRRVKQTTVFRGPLEIGSTLKINVCAHHRVREEKLASWKKLSALAQASANPETMEVKMERSNHLNDEDQTEVEKDDVAQGYRYGRTIVPLTKIDKDGMKLETERCLSVLGFTSMQNIRRHQFIGENVTSFTAQPEDMPSAIALSAFINAMYEKETVAIVRYCFRKNAAPKIGFLSPHIKQNYECLLFSALPFTEDLRNFSFGSLDANRKLQPTAEQLTAIDRLVDALDLTKAVRDENGDYQEALKPKCTFNPTRQRVYQCIQHRALNPQDTTLPELEPVIASYVKPNPEFVARAEPQCLKVKDLFRLERVETKKQSQTAQNVFNSSNNASEPAAKRPHVEDDDTDFSMAKQAKGQVTEVGTVEPVEDFRTLLSNKNINLFKQASNQMKDRIVQLVMDSFGDQFYSKALSCVAALREESIKAEDSQMFNNFFRDLKAKFYEKRGHGFWLLLVKEKLSLISKDESPESLVSHDEAVKFLMDEEKKVPEEAPAEEMEDVDDLLAMME